MAPWGGGPVNTTLGSFSVHNFDGLGGAAGNLNIPAGTNDFMDQDSGGSVIDWDDLGLDPNLSVGFGLLQSGNGIPADSVVRVTCRAAFSSYDTANPPFIYMVGYNWWQQAYVQLNSYDVVMVSGLLRVGASTDIDQWLDMARLQITNPAGAAVAAICEYARVQCNVIQYP